MCGNTFPAVKSNAKYCSRDCWTTGNPETVKAIKRRSAIKNRTRRRERRDANAERLNAAKRERYRTDEAFREHCKEYQRQYIEGRREVQYLADQRRNHGMEWKPLVQSYSDAQDGCCYLCGDPLEHDRKSAVHLDHDHSCCPSGKSCEVCRRGLACQDCNVLIARARDNPERLRRIADNLERANAGVRERMLSMPRGNPSRYEFNCEGCGTPFSASRVDARWCSALCAGRASIARRRAAG